ncbi:peroxidase [Kitasatospora herbaricolor]|uniref:Dyp-type peroxidase n=1 Tax=Kitasatospora herbaricolor TaxID=68217 RepID=UPI00174E8B82|nr:Dyp-type peroxidase [Kitasatospora herbaricolor]MDQ0307406.1 putative iron-dependent peroxidase [Kitasatospora herbaricolor]GGV46837.1 peroxidase [Kitasatospora herbaricolor]
MTPPAGQPARSPAAPPIADLQAVLSPLTSAAVFLVATVTAGGEGTVRELLPELAGLRRSVGSRVPAAGLTCVTSVGAALWTRMFAGPRPAGLHPFRELVGARHRAVSTPGDLLLHIRAERMDLCFELAAQVVDRLAGAATVVDEVHGFKYFDERDLMGFVDGTENPAGRAAEEAVVIGAEDPDFAGGSYVIVQRYVHDMKAWNALPVEEQERVIGRTKSANIELDDEAKPANSHVALNSVNAPDGSQLQILRDNMPYGTVGRGEFGTYFIAYSRTPAVTEEMLRNMFLGKPPGNYDRILDFSTPVTGSLFFTPSAALLGDLPGPPAEQTRGRHRTDPPAGPDPGPDPAPDLVPGPGTGPGPASAPDRAPAPVPAGADGSLGIGSLKRSTAR